MTGLANAQDALNTAKNATINASSSSPAGSMSGLFSNPQVITRLATNPQTRTLLTQPDFMSMLKEIDSNPDAMQKYLQDDRFQLALQVGLGMSVTTPDEFMKQEDEKKEEKEEEEGGKVNDNGNVKKEEEAKITEEATTEDEAMTEEEWEEVNRQKEAQKEKEAGNEAYKKREFDQAIGHYDRAMALYDKDVSFLTNRAAVYFEMQDYAKCIADCDQAVEKGREMRTDFKLIARALARKANALVKLGQLEEAIAVYNRSLTEHRAADTLKKLQETEKTLKDQREQDYIDMCKCEEEKEKGNLSFKQQKYPEAVKHYTEALKRGPAKVNPEAYKLFSNRAACYTKLGAWQDGIKDADECIALNPDFSKGYSRKGHLQYFMKEYNKAMETYEKGLSKDPDNGELKEGLGRCVQAINRMNRGMEEGVSEDEMRLRQEKAMADPEIQGILTDPVMRNVLRDMQEDPQAAQRHLRHPEVAKKLEKLIAAGIVQVQ
jgi:stress-induced-phosphoprotein 1